MTMTTTMAATTRPAQELKMAAYERLFPVTVAGADGAPYEVIDLRHKGNTALAVLADGSTILARTILFIETPTPIQRHRELYAERISRGLSH